ncbi:MAG TPA: hypothetical protein VII87_10880 [Solirubrobacteraceae bacterium]
MVAGVVTPATAQVVVGGQPAQVTGGKFTHPLWLSTPTQVVSVTAQAQGYAPAHTATTINYSPNLAAQLVASAAALTPARAAQAAAPAPAATASAAAIGALNQAIALPKSATSASATGAAASRKKATPTPTTPTHTTPTNTTPTHTTPPAPARPPASSAPPTSTGSGTSQPVSSPVSTVTRIKQSWETGCLQHVKGQNVVPYCRCVYNHLSATGTFTTTKTVNALLKKLHAYSNSGHLLALPRTIRTALLVCSPKLPVLDPLTGAPPLTPLPGLSHKPVPFPVIVRLHPKAH